MKPRVDIYNLSKGRLVRAVALLFLVHTGADLVFPQLCREEPVGIVLNQSFTVAREEARDQESVAASVQASTERGQNSGPSRESPPRDEDCFCCCTHVMPSPLFVDPGVPHANLGKSIQSSVSVASAPLNAPDHPPRFA